MNGIAWKVAFTTTTANDFVWEGEFEEQTSIFDLSSNESLRKNTKIVFEKIFKNGELQVDRNEDKIVFKGNETIRLTREKSLLHHLEEDFIKEIKEAIVKIHLSDHSNSQPVVSQVNFLNINKLLKEIDTLEKIKQSDIDIRGKLYLAYIIEKRIFEKIKERFMDIFPQIEDLKVAPIHHKGDFVNIVIEEYPVIQIKEKGVKKWVVQNRISSGMLRSLFHISELYLSAEGTVFLIDEFENSLGINCIDELTADILQPRRSLQFILTSHHPYIINAISFKHWKLVTRNKGIVKTHNASELNLGKSKHDAFMQLIQLEEYQTGSEST